jgi:glycine hydroxymethyltransferase
VTATPVARVHAVDPEVAALMEREALRQHEKIRLIPSENYMSDAVLAAMDSAFANKYSEGYPGRRYYEGQQVVDPLERLTVERAKALFGAEHVNVQPYSGSPANLAVYQAFLKPGDRVLGMSLPHGGHLTHGWSVSATGRLYDAVHYGVRRETGTIDYDEVRRLAAEHRPGLIWAGGTAVPRIPDYEAFAEIAGEVGAVFAVDLSHVSGLVAGGAHPSPVAVADVVTTTTHKTLRGPRGAMIMCRASHADAIDRAVFPGLQGGPHNHTTAALAVALTEAAKPEFAQYAKQMVSNAQALAGALAERGFELVSGGTDTHLLLIDLTAKQVLGVDAAAALDQAGLELNYNTVPFDPRKPMSPSGIRIGTPSVTSRGMGPAEMETIAGWIDAVISAPRDTETHERIAAEVRDLCAGFPAPGLEFVFEHQLSG